MNTLKPILFLLILLFSNLSVAGYSDEIGNLFKTKEQTDRQCVRAGQLLNDETYSYSYDEVGNLIEKESITEKWHYQWSQGGMLKKVIRPDKKHVDFTYDALGRRLTKSFEEETIHFVWGGNTPLHEWTTSVDETISFVNDVGKSIVSNNPQFEKGGVTQFFIEDFQNKVKPVGDPIDLKRRGCK